jgi:glycosyltransferase involved in cell wall biosynthesis
MDPTLAVVVPVFNGSRTLDACLRAILDDLGDAPAEVLVVDDGSGDGSKEIADRFAADARVRSIRGRRQGAAAAINDGVLLATSSIVCQIDQDVVIHRGWFARVLEPFADPRVAAVQGRYSASVGRGLVARAAGLDLSDRYLHIKGDATNHVCTGNVAYRASALRAVGLLDETLGTATTTI